MGPNYKEVQRVLTNYAHLQEALQSALEEACRNEGHKMQLKGFREEEHIDHSTGAKTILVYAQFTPVLQAHLTELNPRDLNDAASQNGENGIPRPSQLAHGDGVPADQRFGSGEVSGVSQVEETYREPNAGGALPL